MSSPNNNEELMSNVINNMNSGFALHEMIYDKAGNPVDVRFLKVNPAFMELVGVGDPTGRMARDVYPNLDDSWIDIFGEITRTGISKKFQKYLCDVGKWWQIFAFKVADSQFAFVFHDITDLKKGQEILKVEVGELEVLVAERTKELQDANTKLVEQVVESRNADEALRRSEETYRLLLSNIDLGVTLVDADYNVLFVNEAQCRIMNKNQDKLLGRKCYKAFQKKKLTCDDCPGTKAMATGTTFEVENYGVLDDGSTVPVRVTAFPVTIGDGGSGFIEVVEDITDRKKTDEELLQYEDKLRSLASKLTLGEEHERHRIASGLHDSIIQPLIFLRIKLDSLERNKSVSEQSESIKSMRKTIDDLVKITREFTFELSYPILYELGLETAIDEWLTEEISGKHGIKTFFSDDGHCKPLSRDLRSFLFESVRELLVNIIKHAKAENVRVDVCSEDGIIVITVEDDGIGFDIDERLSLVGKGSGSCFGLFSIRERLSYFKGSLEIVSSPGNGSKMILKAPLVSCK